MDNASNRFALFEPRTNYNAVAEVYDRARPSYPDELIDDVLAYAEAPAGARALEIGCGTGQATGSFAARGLELLGLEPAPALAEIARQRLSAHDRVKIVTEAFEAWHVEEPPFDLVYSATAFHWVPRRIRFIKAAQILRPGGTLAVFNAVADATSSALPDPVKRILRRDHDQVQAGEKWPFEKQFQESGSFGRIARRLYAVERSYDGAGLESLLRSLNRFRSLSDSEQGELAGIARAAVDAQGGDLSLKFRVKLIMARRVPDPPRWKSLYRRWLSRSK